MSSGHFRIREPKSALIPGLALVMSLASLPALAELNLSIVATPDPAELGETVEMVATITNTDDFDRQAVTFDLLTPQEVDGWARTSVGGGLAVRCSGGSWCHPGHLMTTDLGTVRAGTSKTVALLTTTKTDEDFASNAITSVEPQPTLTVRTTGSTN